MFFTLLQNINTSATSSQCSISPGLTVASSQLLSNLLAPVSDQVHERISDFCGVPSVRALIKSSINIYSSQVVEPPPCRPHSVKTLKIIPLLPARQACSESLLSSEVSLPPCPGRKGQGCEGDAETSRVDHCLILKRKWRSTVEEVDPGGTERSSKRSKSGEELEHQLQLVSFFLDFLSFLLNSVFFSIQGQQTPRILSSLIWIPPTWTVHCA